MIEIKNSNMAASSGDMTFPPCDDFFQFEDALKRMRIKDDKIIYELNVALPTQSFERNIDTTRQCKNLYEQLTKIYDEREKAIKRCIGVAAEGVKRQREIYLRDRDDAEAVRNLRNAQNKLRMMQKELSVDEVIKDRSFKVFYERCRNSYKPPDSPVV